MNKKTLTTNQSTLIAALAAVIRVGQIPAALAARRANVEISSTTENLPVRHLSVSARKLPRKWVFIEGSDQSSFDWLLMRLVDDPLYGDRRGFPLPMDVKTKLQAIHNSGLVFDDLWIAHELRRGSFNKNSRPTVADLYPAECLKQPVVRPSPAKGIFSCLNVLLRSGAFLGDVAGKGIAEAFSDTLPVYVPEPFVTPKPLAAPESPAMPEPFSVPVVFDHKEEKQLALSENRQAEAERVAAIFEAERLGAQARKQAAIEAHNRQEAIEAEIQSLACARRQAEAERIAYVEAERQAEIERLAAVRREEERKVKAEQDRKNAVDAAMWQRMRDGRHEKQVLDTGRQHRWDLYDFDEKLFRYNRDYACWSLVRFGGSREYDERNEEMTYSCQGHQATYPDPILLGVNYEGAYADLFYLAHWRY